MQRKFILGATNRDIYMFATVDMGLHKRSDALFVDHDGNLFEAVTDPYRLRGMQGVTVIIGWPWHRVHGRQREMFDEVIKTCGFTVDASNNFG